jgi:hypothetical protein
MRPACTHQAPDKGYVFRKRHAQVLLAASKGVLQASGSLKEIQRRLNQTVSKLARCQHITVVAYYDPGRWYLTPAGSCHPLQVRTYCSCAHIVAFPSPFNLPVLWASSLWHALVIPRCCNCSTIVMNGKAVVLNRLWSNHLLYVNSPINREH